jgi:hypothetical protein
MYFGGYNSMKKYDVAAYVWPAYTGDEPRTRIFWPEGIGEWQSVKNAVGKFPGHNWPRKPLWGYVNEADRYVMEMEIAAAADHGVNVFIYDWYWYDRRPFLENCLCDGFLKAQNRDRMKFYLMWANHSVNFTWDIRNSDDQSTVIWDGAVDRREFDIICMRLIERFFSQPNYYKINGCPVIMIYDLHNLVRGLGGVEQTRRALDDFRELAVKAGHPGLHLQLTAWSEHAVNLSGVDINAKGTTRDAVVLLGFDSISHYQFVHFVNIDRDYREILADVKREWDRIDRDYQGTPYFPHISIGWDNNPRFTSFRAGIVRGNTPEAFEEGLRMAKAYVDSHPSLPAPLITINSWNEWTETSYLEPDDLYDYGYLEAVRRVFGR